MHWDAFCDSTHRFCDSAISSWWPSTGWSRSRNIFIAMFSFDGKYQHPQTLPHLFCAIPVPEMQTFSSIHQDVRRQFFIFRLVYLYGCRPYRLPTRLTITRHPAFWPPALLSVRPSDIRSNRRLVCQPTSTLTGHSDCHPVCMQIHLYVLLSACLLFRPPARNPDRYLANLPSSFCFANRFPPASPSVRERSTRGEVGPGSVHSANFLPPFNPSRSPPTYLVIRSAGFCRGSGIPSGDNDRWNQIAYQ